MPELKRLAIRMYRGILGDCFLIRTLLTEDGAEITRNILIDCGVLQNVASGADMIKKLKPKIIAGVGKARLQAVEAGPERIKAVAEDVLKEVGGRIDLLIITHEHYDHLSGFGFKKNGFLDPSLTINRLWMAWTESPMDAQAKALRARFAKGKQALAAVAALALTNGADELPKLVNAASLAAFSGPAPVRGLAAAGAFSTADVLAMLKDKAGKNATEYLEPGQVISLENFGLKAYVLGPPRDEALLRKDLPSRGHAKEVYLTHLNVAAAAESTAFSQLSLRGALVDKAVQHGDIVPFGSNHISPINAKPLGKRRVKRPKASEASQAIEKVYYRRGESWRRIDNEWTGSLEALALKMDSDTNNTSLALAFELPDGQVLVFPGDAQVGNWLSWNNQTYPPAMPAGSSGEPVTAEDLLRRATFYKAGHHGSHNSTLKALGLERMIDPRLVAAIPVVGAVAAVQGKGRSEAGKGWKMPFGELYDALNKKTKGRIVQGDGDPLREKRAFSKYPTSPQNPVSVTHNPLWVELTFKLA